MKRRLVSILLALCMVLAMLPTAFASGNTTEFAGGTGVEGDPYLISTVTHLNNVRNYLDAHFKMVNDIEFAAADFAEGGAFYNSGAGWTPIGASFTNPFTGTFDGNGFAIKNLYVNISGSSASVCAGLFGVNEGTIQNLGVVDGDITAYTTSGGVFAGSIAGSGRGDGTITNCYSTGSVKATDTASYETAYAGGIVGETYGDGTVTNCYNIGTVKATATGTSARAYAGGIAGMTYTDSTVSNCYNTGSASAFADDSCAGGILGAGTATTISNCYNIGSVYASGDFTAYAGGVAGSCGTVISCYNAGSVTESCAYTNCAGGIAGSCGTVTNCYYLDSIDKGIGRYTDGGVKCTDAQMQQQSTFSGFDFTDVWTMGGNATYPYPELKSLEQRPCTTHTQKPVAGYGATCTEPGLTDGVQCTVCRYWITPQEPITESGHKPAAQWSFDGTDHWKVCSTKNCGVLLADTKEQHSATGANRATCIKLAICDTCNTTYGDYAQHSYTAEVQKEEALKSKATHQDYAVYYYSCAICGDVEGDDAHTFLGDELLSISGVYRLAGRNRFDTAFQSADALKDVMGVDKFPAAIVTSGMNFADALAGSYLAAVTGAPILLTDNDNMADVIAYIRENVKAGGTIYALGGTAVVADTLKAVESRGFTFKRLAGSNRFETNLMILEEAGIESGDPVLVCTAYNFADSLSASALGLPILLVDDTVSAAQMAFLEENADGEFILVGGTGAVKPAVEQQLREKWDVVRLAGNNRFETSVLTAIEAFGSSGVDYAVLAYGYNFPDGLCAGPLAYALGAPLILTANGDEGPATVYANNAGIESGFVLGGPSLISDGVVYRVFSMGAGDNIM